eukprot:CAMPEP_0179879770 /NCGR_PEP_ID=MMETSP0982-20121206/26393_1 /TAXON_ID=483367 /ORGANISM="non described non described, Strain CCMP 2436" /LENGTH=230 /DNA_ID=CAMNT_0021773243 /DNA_START=157 /DNA_END=847 /DNA_ORIENTATION=+
MSTREAGQSRRSRQLDTKPEHLETGGLPLDTLQLAASGAAVNLIAFAELDRSLGPGVTGYAPAGRRQHAQSQSFTACSSIAPSVWSAQWSLQPNVVEEVLEAVVTEDKVGADELHGARRVEVVLQLLALEELGETAPHFVDPHLAKARHLARNELARRDGLEGKYHGDLRVLAGLLRNFHVRGEYLVRAPHVSLACEGLDDRARVLLADLLVVERELVEKELKDGVIAVR